MVDTGGVKVVERARNSTQKSSKTSEITLHALNQLPTDDFWEMALKNHSRIQLEIAGVCASARKGGSKDITVADADIIHFFMRINSHRMQAAKRTPQAAFDTCLRRILGKRPIHTLAEVALIVQKTRNPGTAGIAIGGLLASSAALASHLPGFGCAWGEAMEANVRKLHLTVSGRENRTEARPMVQPLIENILSDVKALCALLRSCPFISDYLSPDALFRGLAWAVEMTPTIVRETQLLFTIDAMQAAQLVALLQKIRREALKAAAVLCVFLHPALRPDISREADASLTCRIEATCNSVCAAAMRYLGISFSEWFAIVCGGQPHSESTEKNFSDARAACLSRIRGAVSTVKSTKGQSKETFYDIMADWIDRKEIAQPENPLLQAPKDSAPEDPAVAQLKELFPQWNASAIPDLLRRYDNSIETIVGEAFASNLPPDLQEALNTRQEDEPQSYEAPPAAPEPGFSLFAAGTGAQGDDNTIAASNHGTYDVFAERDDAYEFQGLLVGEVSKACERVYADEPVDDLE